MGIILAIAILSTLASYAVPPFDTLRAFVFSQVASFFTILILSVVGGAAVGMLVAHRILSSRDFSPYERSVLEALTDIRERLDRLEQERREPPAAERPRR